MSLSRFPNAPLRIGRLSVDHRGIPVPWFVSWRDGKPLFPVIDGAKLTVAWSDELCWVCGEKLGSYRAWVMGPMSVIEGATPEPPSHKECAEFSACNCPHLSTHTAKYSEKYSDSPNYVPQENISKIRSCVTAIWTTKRRGATPFQAGKGLLFALENPTRIEWYAHGRAATSCEIQDAIAIVLPTLKRTAEAQGRKAEFERRLEWLKGWAERP